MTPDRCFLEYAIEFEATYLDDDWTRLERFFAEDATYEVRNGPFACTIRGRTNVLQGLKRSLDGFDRRCTTRRIRVTDPPVTTGDTVTVGWEATYEWPGAPPLVFAGRSTATTANGCITHLLDDYADGEGERMVAWVRAWAPDLDPGYV